MSSTAQKNLSLIRRRLDGGGPMTYLPWRHRRTRGSPLREEQPIHFCRSGLRLFRHPPESAERLLSEIRVMRKSYLQAVELPGPDGVVKKNPFSYAQAGAGFQQNLSVHVSVSLM